MSETNVVVGFFLIMFTFLLGVNIFSMVANKHASIANAEGHITNVTNCEVNCVRDACVVSGTIHLTWTYDNKNYSAETQTPQICVIHCCEDYVNNHMPVYVFIDKSIPHMIDDISDSPKKPEFGYVFLAVIASITFGSVLAVLI